MDNLTPKRIREWLNSRGLSDAVLELNKIGWNGTHIVIPVFDKDGKHLFNKYRRDPASEDGPKYTYETGATVNLYGLNHINKDVKEVIICEGEFDCLLLQSKGFNAVTSTGGAVSFQEDWAPLFEGIDTYVCFDNDKAGESGKMKVFRLVRHAKNVPLPPEVGEHGDITDFFIKLGNTAEDFRAYMEVSEAVPIKEEHEERSHRTYTGDTSDREQAKKVPLGELLKFNRQHFAICPFHKEKTPSLKKYKDNRWYCFGCGVGGDTIDLVMKMNDCSLPEAIKKILSA